MFQRVFLLLLIALLVRGTSWAASDAFAGKWKLNPLRSQLSDQMKVESVGANKYTIDFGGGTETVVADGTDQPGIFGIDLSVTVEGPDSWKVTRKKDGRLLISAIWRLSGDGNTLTDDFTGYRPDGSTSKLDYVYKRIAGRSGFPGTWESVSEKMSSGYELQISPYDGDGLSFVNAAQKSTKDLKFDGKEYPSSGINVPAGYASSGHRVDERVLELTDKINGKVIDTQRVELSPDLNTLIMTLNTPGRSKPNILVFDRQ